MRFPKHECGLYLEHNVYRNYYDSIESAVAQEDELTTWESDEHKKRAIETKQLWTLQWYPNTPIGFYRVAAPTLEELLTFALTFEEPTNE